MARSLHSKQQVRLRELLVEARTKAGLTQGALAALLDHPKSFCSQGVGGERRLDVVEFIELCDVLGTSPGGIIAALEKTR